MSLPATFALPLAPVAAAPDSGHRHYSTLVPTPAASAPPSAPTRCVALCPFERACPRLIWLPDGESRCMVVPSATDLVAGASSGATADLADRGHPLGH